MCISNGIIVVHKGALGDFLQIWPSLLALSRHYSHLPLYWAGRDAYRLWTDPLGFTPCPGLIRQAVDRLYASDTWPVELRGNRIIWFGLHTPPTTIPFPGLVFLPGIVPGKLNPPRRIYAAGLERLGIQACRDWLQTWQSMFARNMTQIGTDRVLLLPGAGHRAKCWPLPKYLGLASWLDKQGFDPIFVLGPAELDRGMEVQNFKLLYPMDLCSLQNCLLKAQIVVGNDSGPMHLAGFLGRPGLVLFGPAAASQWGPIGLTCLQTEASCSPCTQTGHIPCTQPMCMEQISRATVQKAFISLVQNREEK